MKARDFEAVKWARAATEKRMRFFWEMVRAASKKVSSHPTNGKPRG